jgi:hypothetical protein
VLVECAVCEKEFEAKRSTAKYCGDRCRQLAKRRRAGDEPEAPAHSSELVKEIRKELTRLRQLHSVDGQLALELSIKITTPGMTGVASLSRELRSLRSQIRMNAAPPKPSGPEPKDMVAEARKRREAIARQARTRRA